MIDKMSDEEIKQLQAQVLRNQLEEQNRQAKVRQVQGSAGYGVFILVLALIGTVCSPWFLCAAMCADAAHNANQER